MSKESSPSQSRSFHESIRILHGFLQEKRDNGVISMEEVDNFAQKERLVFGYNQENGNHRSYKIHLQFLQRQGAIEILEDNETEFIRLVNKQDLP